jgi:hypothetical protein
VHLTVADGVLTLEGEVAHIAAKKLALGLAAAVPTEEGPFGARAVAEPPGLGSPAVTANAIEDVVGVRIKELPLSPDKLLRGLRGEPLEDVSLDLALLRRLRGRQPHPVGQHCQRGFAPGRGSEGREPTGFSTSVGSETPDIPAVQRVCAQVRSISVEVKSAGAQRRRR